MIFLIDSVMKTIIPLKSSVEIINNKLKTNEICIILKHFAESDVNLKVGFKEVGFVFETVKDSVFFQSYFIQEFKQKYLNWLIENHLYKFFVYKSGFFFLSDLFSFKDFYSFLFIYLFMLRTDNMVFFTFLINGNLIFLNFKYHNLIFKIFFNLIEKVFFFKQNSVELNLLSFKKMNTMLTKNYSFFSVWFYFFSILRNFLFFFVLKFYMYIIFQSKLFLQCQLCFNQ